MVVALLLAQLASVPQVVTFHSDVDDTDQPYVLYVPKSIDRARKYPVVISLRDESAEPRLNVLRLLQHHDIDYFVACPFTRGAPAYQGIPEREIYEVLADLKQRYPVDDDRVYLTGAGLGGAGALWLALTRPDTWAAVALLGPAALQKAEEFAANALNLPIRLFHGDQDPLVPVEQSRQWHKRLLDLGVQVEYNEYPGIRHNVWDRAYKDGAIFDWFARFRRPDRPERVRFQTRAYKYSTDSWVRLDSFTPGELASIDARSAARNRIAVATHNLDGFTLSFPSAVPRAIVIDGTAVISRVAASLSFHRTVLGWKPGRAETSPGDKRSGAEGPIADAITPRHIYVYGMADSPGPDELRERQQTARHAAAWSAPDTNPAISFAVKSDKQVTTKDLEDSNLVLFGTKETNSLIASFAGRLPLALNPGAPDYGLVFVAPLGKHYVVVNSGLPWWTGAGKVDRPGLHGTAPLPCRVLETFGDFILFRGSLDDVVVEGRFDRHWKLPAAAAAKIREAGTVVIQ